MLYKVYTLGDIIRVVGIKHRQGTERSLRLSVGNAASPDDRLAASLSRAKRSIREIALCNPWEFFVTLTLRQDRYDLPKFKKDFGVWVGNYNKKYSVKLAYLVIPEEHKDGATHAHGLFQNVAAASLIHNSYGYLDMPYYYNRFGYISLSPVRDHDRAASYITKYVTKQPHSQLGSGEHMFFSSHGLQRAELVGSIFLYKKHAPPPHYENDYVQIYEYKPNQILPQIFVQEFRPYEREE